MMKQQRFNPGDSVVYRKSKQTTNPGPRAQSIRAARKGDHYSYCVDKFWVVRQVLGNGKLLVETRRGKVHVLDVNDPNLRRPSLLQRIRYRDRFAQLHRPQAAG
jgi:hypothetical protein